MSEEILHIRKGAGRSDDITSMQYHTYTPYTTAFNNNDEIRIVIQSQDLITLPSDSYVLIEFKPVRHDGTSQIKLEKATFSRTSALNFFTEMRYELNGIEIDRCKSPAITSQLKTMIACKSSDTSALNSMTWLANKQVMSTTYRLMIPLKFIFGFFDDYNKVVVNCKHELILLRSHNDSNVYIADEETLKFEIQKVHWKVPHVALSDHAKTGIMKTIERKEDLPLTFRSWDLYELPNVLQSDRNIWSVKTTTQTTKPRYVVVAFQTKRNHVVSADPKLFDHCDISNIRLYLNNDRYPYDDMNLNFAHGDYCEAFSMLDRIQNGYYNGTQGPNPADMLEFIQDKSVIFFAFDCSRSDESIKNGMVDVRIEMDAHSSFPAHTTAYCLIIHDNFLRYNPATGIVQRNIA